jgi:hypothetical protein
VCKKCLRVFHLGPGGRAVLGEPPEPKEVPQAKPVRESSGFEMGGSLDELAARLVKLKLPNVSPRTLGIIGGVAFVLALGFWFFSRLSVEKRTENFAKSFVKADMKTVLDMNAAGTEIDTMQWFNDVYRRWGELKLALGQDPGATVKVIADGSNGPAVVVLRFSSEGTRFGDHLSDALIPRPNAANPPQALELHLYWVKDSWGNWVLDGKRTAEDKP